MIHKKKFIKTPNRSTYYKIYCNKLNYIYGNPLKSARVSPQESKITNDYLYTKVSRKSKYKFRW